MSEHETFTFVVSVKHIDRATARWALMANLDDDFTVADAPVFAPLEWRAIADTVYDAAYLEEEEAEHTHTARWRALTEEQCAVLKAKHNAQADHLYGLHARIVSSVPEAARNYELEEDA